MFKIITFLSLILPINFCSENVDFLCLLHNIIQMYLKFVVIMETNTMNLGTACSGPILFSIQGFRGSLMKPKWQKLASLAQEICIL